MGRTAERLEKQLDTFTTGEAAVLVRPVQGQTHSQVKAELERAMTGMDRTRFHFDVSVDGTGHGWVILKGERLTELTDGMGQLAEVFGLAGMADRVVAGVFPFRWHDSTLGRDRTIYWIYQPRIRGFTPFVPEGQGEERNHDLEIRMESAIRRDLPTNRETTEWYPIWDMPV